MSYNTKDIKIPWEFDKFDKNVKLQRAVIEVFVVVMHAKCVRNQIQEEKKILQEKCLWKHLKMFLIK